MVSSVKSSRLLVGADLIRWLLPAGLILILVLCDQWSKRWVVARLGPQPGEQMLESGLPWLRIVYTQNTGVAFSLFQGMPTFFTATSIVITIGMIIAYITYLPNRVPLVQFSMGLIVGGALGNIIDRLRLGFVVDFIAVGWWPVFNIADSAITVGVILLAGYLMIIGDEPPPPPLSMPHDEHLLNELLTRDVDDA